MKNFECVLVPIDFSSHSDEAVSIALKLCANTTQLHLIHIMQMPAIADPSGMIYLDVNVEEVYAALFEKLKQVRNEIVSIRQELTVTTHLKKGYDVVELVAETASEITPDLIVVGSHGRKGISRILMGSVAESLMRTANCPVLIVKPAKK